MNVLSFRDTDIDDRVIVDENLYYMATDKSRAGHARRDQTHGVSPKALPAPGEEAEQPDEAREERQPAFLFASSKQLVQMSKDHNVSMACPKGGAY